MTKLDAAKFDGAKFDTGASADALATAEVDLTSCDREPIHVLGGVQPFGVLVAISADWIVSSASVNVVDVLGVDHADLVGTSLADHLRPEATAAIRARIAQLGFPDAVERAFGLVLAGDGRAFDVAVHVSGQNVVIEAEPSHGPRPHADGAQVRPLIGRVVRTRTTQEMCAVGARQLRALTGFDRVMVYRFGEDGSGEVIAESRLAALEPFEGLRYPATDIPKQARALYVRNLTRIISDVNADPVPIEPYHGPDGRPLDLSMSTLRAVSPIHHEYLRNMGVRASMSVSILRRGKLWGLFACHHHAPRVLPYSLRTMAELFGQFFSFALEQREADEERGLFERTRSSHQAISRMVAETGSIAENFEAFTEALGDVVPFGGAALSMEGRVRLGGRTPGEAEVRELIRFLNTAASDRVYATDELAAHHPPAKGYQDVGAGVMALPISRSPRDYLVLFRGEVSRTVTWAGRPDKPVEVGPNGTRLTPRKSFEAWKQTVSGRSAPWTPAELSAANDLRVTMLEVVLRLTDEAARERASAQERQELLIAELNHRVRNILNLIRGLVGQSRAGEQTIDDFVGKVGRRIQALARAHDQITDEQWQPGSLRELIETEAQAYADGKDARLDVEGPDVLVQPTAFTVLSLVVHELLTNAMKYGALGSEEGRVTIRMVPEADGGLTLHWREEGGPPVQAPTRRGFGSTIIERSVPYELKGKADLSYEVGGVRARFYVPAAFVERVAAGRAGAPAGASAPALAEVRGRALVVEDNMIIGLDAEMLMEELGADEVVLASCVADALAAMRDRPFDAALLDVNLGPETSEPIAKALAEAGVPFVFATGYGEVDGLTTGFDVPVVRKPYAADAVRSAFAAVL